MLVFLLVHQAWASDITLPHYTGSVLPDVQTNVNKPEFNAISSRWSVKIPDGASDAMKLAKRLLEQRLVEQRAKADKNPDEAGRADLVITLGRLADAKVIEADAGVALAVTEQNLPPQGYIIRVRQKAGTLHLFALGTDDRGVFYGAATLIQQIGVEGGLLGLRTNDINDWPAWKERYFGDYSPYGSTAMTWCALNKISGYAIQHRTEWRDFAADVKPRWSKFGTWQEALDDMNKVNGSSDLMDFMIILHIYAAAQRQHPKINIAKEEDVRAFIETCRYAAKNGFDHILIAADDMTRHDGERYVVNYPEEKARFNDSIGLAHGYLVKRVYEVLIKEYPNLKFSFCPAPYSLYDHRVPQLKGNQRYLRDMAQEMPDAVKVVWTGPKVLSDHISKADSDAFRAYVGNHPLLLWDNTNETGRPPMPVWNTRFDNDYVKEAEIIYGNAHLFGWPWDQPFAVAGNSYLWNPNGFEATREHARAVAQMFGKGADQLSDAFIKDKLALEDLDEPVDKKLERVAALKRIVDQMDARQMPTMHLRGFVSSREGRLTTEIPTLSVPVFDNPIKPDGMLEDKSWQGAATFELGPANRDRKEKYPAKGMIGYDAKNLYLAFIVRHSTTLKPPSIPNRRDEEIYKESDAVELFIQPDGTEDYGHMVFDFVGHLYDNHHGDEKAQGLGWNPDWKVAIHRLEEGQWTAEVVIPFESLKPFATKPPASGTTWRANFCRYSIHDSQVSNWSATFGKFHQTQRFGFLKFQ
jgi:hypothetical protein